jgi:hypothetical protein
VLDWRAYNYTLFYQNIGLDLIEKEIDIIHIKPKPTYNRGMYSRRCLQMENSRPKSEDTMIKKSAPKKETRYSQSKEYDTFINILASVVEKYGVEILEEIDCAV